MPTSEIELSTKHWSIDDLPWSELAVERVDQGLLETVKTAALVEANSADYVTYLHNVFHDDEVFKAAASYWGVEERQHGDALARWAKLVDPSFDFERSLKYFRAGYQIPLDVQTSVRGSQAGELIARCVVESGTHSFYSALRDASEEPVLKVICARIAEDEARHYKLFKDHLARYQKTHPLGWWARIKIAFGRVSETDDDELAFAFYSANRAFVGDQTYDRRDCARAYWRRAMGYYQFQHVRKAAHMILKSLGLNPNHTIAKACIRLSWYALRWQTSRLSAVQS